MQFSMDGHYNTTNLTLRKWTFRWKLLTLSEIQQIHKINRTNRSSAAPWFDANGAFRWTVMPLDEKGHCFLLASPSCLKAAIIANFSLYASHKWGHCFLSLEWMVNSEYLVRSWKDLKIQPVRFWKCFSLHFLDDWVPVLQPRQIPLIHTVSESNNRSIRRLNPL